MPEFPEGGRKAAGGNFNGLHGTGDNSFKERRTFVGKDDFGMHHAARSLAQEIRIPEDQERLSVFPGYRTALEVANGQATFSLGLDDIGNVSGRAEISLQLRDASGNASPLSPAHAFDVDTLSPLPPRLDSWMADDRINKQEWDADLIAPITGQLLEAGATLTARLRQGDTFIDLAASSGANGSWTIDRNELLNALQRIGDGAFSIEVKQTDLAGNVSPTQIQQYYMDRTRPGRPALIAAPCTEDGWINLRDAGSERVELRISLADTQAVAGDRIVISDRKSVV